MANCNISGQTVISGYYALFADADGGKHFFAMQSPVGRRGEEPTFPVDIEQVAEYIAGLDVEPDEEGRLGTLRWNPKEIRWRGVLMTFLTPVRIPLVPGDAESILEQLMKGGSTRVSRFVDIPETGDRMVVDVDQFIPPLLFGNVEALQTARMG